MRWFPVAFLTSGISKVTHGGIELTTPVLRVRMLNHYATTPLLSLFEANWTFQISRIAMGIWCYCCNSCLLVKGTEPMVVHVSGGLFTFPGSKTWCDTRGIMA